ncbi:MAG: hypothetical protein HYV32_02790 [Candidatus Kerfeldbacteria bacterium]|nr:hypothetical protein [Candidatus Kerfeldbacteria bacterium]
MNKRDNQLFRKLLQHRRDIRAVITAEKSEKGKWGIYGEGKFSYTQTFEKLLDGRSLDDLIREKREKTDTVVALDLMGEGQVLREVDIDAGLAVTLVDRRSSEKKQIDMEKDIDMITDNVVYKSTWRQIEGWVARSTKKRGLDFIFCRPIGGIYTLPKDDMDLYYYLVQQMWNMLSPENGMILSQAPLYIHRNGRTRQDLLAPWFNTLMETVHCRIADDRLSFQLIKTPDAPALLPTLPTSQ